MTDALAIPSATEPNLASAPDLLKYFDENGEPQKPFNEWFKTKCGQLEQQNQAEWQELHLVWELINKFIEGKQILRRRHRGFGWDVIPLPESTTSMVREQNKLGFYSHVLMSKWVASRTKIEAIPGDDSDQSAGAARAAQSFNDALSPLVYSEKFRQQEAIAGQVHGTYARYFYYDEEADGGYGYKPITEQQSFKAGDDIAECFDCGFAGLAEEFGASPAPVEPDAVSLAASPSGEQGAEAPMPVEGDTGAPVGDVQASGQVCPSCGSSNIQVTPAPEEQIEVVTGVEQYKLGNLRALSIPYSQLRHEISCSLEESPWMRWRRRIRMEEIKAAFPGIKLSPPDARGTDTGLEYEEAMRRAIAANNTSARGAGSKDRDHYSDFTQWWFAPCMYADYTFPVDVQTAAGETIPAGTKAAEVFPDGMYAAVVEGVDAPLQLRNESHKWHWISAPYHLRMFTGLGIGINDAVEMQRQWNLILSLVFTQIRTAALPGWLYDKDTIAPDEVRRLGQPQNSVPASLRNKPEGTRIEHLVYQMQPGQIPAHIPWYVQQLDANMQTSMGSLVNEGVPGMDSKTATGAQLMASASNQHNAPEFALKGDADKRSALILFELAKKHFVEPRYLPISGKRGKQDGIWLSAADFANGQVRFEAVADSWMPNTKLDKQESIQKLLLMFGGILGLMQAQAAMPDFVAEVAESFNLDIAGDIFEPTTLLCRQRVDQITELAASYAPLLEQMEAMNAMQPMVEVDPNGMAMPVNPTALIGDEMIAQLTPPVIVEEPGHMVAIKWLRELLLDDEMKEADPVTRAGVQALIRAHLQFAMMEQQIMAGMAAIANPQPEEDPNGPQQPEKTAKDKQADSAKSNLGGSGQGKQPNPRPQPQAQPTL